MNISFLHKPLGCLLIVIILFAIAGSIISSTVNMVEVNIIKWFDPSHKTRYEIAKEEKEKQAEIAEEETKKKEDIEKILAKKLGIKSLYNFGKNPEIFFVNDKEVYAIVPLDKYGEKILTKTTDGGENWKTILATTENHVLKKISVNSGTITVYLNLMGTLKAQSNDGGENWSYLDGLDKPINEPLPIKDGKIAVYPLKS